MSYKRYAWVQKCNLKSVNNSTQPQKPHWESVQVCLSLLQLYWVLLFPSVRAHTFLLRSLQQLLLFAATIYFICCNYFLFAATTFYLQQLYLICCNFILFAATLFNCSNFLFAACPLWATVVRDADVETKLKIEAKHSVDILWYF